MGAAKFRYFTLSHSALFVALNDLDIWFALSTNDLLRKRNRSNSLKRKDHQLMCLQKSFFNLSYSLCFIV